MVDLTGQVLGERYRVDAFLGRGGMADVYKVWDMQRAVFLALKALHADLAEDKLLLRRFEQEARTLEALQHPNIVRFYGLEHTPAGACILMDYIDGLTLRKEIFLNQSGLPGERILEVMQPVCAALYYAHQNGRVHCDIKPANIISHSNGVIYLADFGIARMAEGGTQTPIGAGTPAYMAPEQLDGRVPTPAADIYSLGVVLFEMVTGGQRPFTGDSARTKGSTTQRIVWEKHHLPAPSPRKYQPNLSAELESVIMRCLERKASRRYPTTLDLYQSLEAAIRSSEIMEDDELNTQVEIAHLASKAAPNAKAGAKARSGTKVSASRGAASKASDNAPLNAPLPANAQPPRNGSSTAQAGSGDGVGQPGADQSVVKKPGNGTAGKIVPPVQLATSKQAGATGGWRAIENAQVGLTVEPQDDAESLSDDDYIPPFWRVYLTRRNLIIAGISALVVTVLALGLLTQPAHAPALNQTATVPEASLPQGTALAGALSPLATSGPAASLTPPQAKITATTGGANRDATLTPAVTPALTEGVMQPTSLGGSGKIAFASDRSGSVQVWVMNASNPDDREMITNEDGGACQPAWSPDGTQIAYTTPCQGPSIYYQRAIIKIIRLADHAVTNLPLRGASFFDPAWSPDGQTLAFTALVNSSIIQSISLKDMKTITTLAQRGAKNAQPAFSPDGQFIAFITSDDHHTDSLWLMRASGESQEVLSNAGQFSEPTWTPDGSKLLVSMRKNNNIPVLALVDRANPTPGGVPLLKGEYRMSHGTISPDGQWVLFWSDKIKNNTEIFQASASTSAAFKMDPRQLTNNNLQDFQPAWAP